VFNDSVINAHHADTADTPNLPIMNLQERVLSVLGCRYTDDVLIDAPYIITKDMINSLNISKVLIHKHGDSIIYGNEQCYEVAEKLGLVEYVDGYDHQTLSGNISYVYIIIVDICYFISYFYYILLIVMDIVSRIQMQRDRFQKK